MHELILDSIENLIMTINSKMMEVSLSNKGFITSAIDQRTFDHLYLYLCLVFIECDFISK